MGRVSADSYRKREIIKQLQSGTTRGTKPRKLDEAEIENLRAELAAVKARIRPVALVNMHTTCEVRGLKEHMDEKLDELGRRFGVTDVPKGASAEEQLRANRDSQLA